MAAKYVLSNDLCRHVKLVALASHNPQSHCQLEVTAPVAFEDSADSYAHMRRVDTSRRSISTGPGDTMCNGPGDATCHGPGDAATNGPGDAASNGPGDAASNGPGDTVEPTIHITPLSLQSQHRAHTPKGGFEADFVTGLDDKHRCPICLLALREPVQTNCGHRFCRWCFENRQQQFSCPVDNMPLLKVFPDNLCKREVLCLPVECPNCSWIGELRNLQNHIDECFMIYVLCPHVHRGCQCRLPQSKLQEHLSECEYRNAACTLCRAMVPLNVLEDHQRNICPEVEIMCTNNCGATVKRKEMADHINNVCRNTITPCHFSEIGCQFMGNPFSLEDHIAGSYDYHMTLSCQNIASLKRQVNQLKAEVAKLKDKDQEKDRRINQLESSMGEMRQQLVSVSERLSQVEVHQNAEQQVGAEAATLAQPAETGSNAASAKAMKVVKSAGMDAQDDTEMSVVHQNATSGATTTFQSGHYNGVIGRTDAIVAEFDLRLLSQETTSFGGVLLWKIPDFNRYFELARTGKKPSLYSPPFYTSRHGYKMCARVYLYGDGVGKSSHMSFFFVMMRGEFDALLAWPFHQKVTLTLLDQSPGKCHISDTFMPDPSSSSFQRPSSEVNIASGCPRFISIAMLWTANGYVTDNTIFLRVDVDSTGLALY